MKTLRWVFLTVLVIAFSQTPTVTLAESSTTDLDVARQLNRAFVEIAERVSKGVVVINVVQKESLANFEDMEEDDRPDSKPPGFWKRFHEQFKHPPLEKTIGQ